MFIPLYESRRITFADRGAVIVTRTPCPQEPYGAQLEDDAGEPITAWGTTVLEAIAALEAQLTEQE